MIPDFRHIVDEIRHGFDWDFTTEEGLCAYSRTVILALNAHDPAFGHLVKRESQPHCTDPLGRLAAVDATLYVSTGQVVDFIRSSGPRPRFLEGGALNPEYPGNEVAWTVGPLDEYPPASWFAPVTGAIPRPPAPGDEGSDVDPATPATQRQIEDLFNLHAEVHKQLGVLNKQGETLTERVRQLEDRVLKLETAPAPEPTPAPRPPRWWPF